MYVQKPFQLAFENKLHRFEPHGDEVPTQDMIDECKLVEKGLMGKTKPPKPKPVEENKDK